MHALIKHYQQKTFVVVYLPVHMPSRINPAAHDLIYLHIPFDITGDIPELVYFLSMIYNSCLCK